MPGRRPEHEPAQRPLPPPQQPAGDGAAQDLRCFWCLSGIAASGPRAGPAGRNGSALALFRCDWCGAQCCAWHIQTAADDDCWGGALPALLCPRCAQLCLRAGMPWPVWRRQAD